MCVCVAVRARTNYWSLNFIQLSTYKLPKSQRAFWLDRVQKVNGTTDVQPHHFTYRLLHTYLSLHRQSSLLIALSHTHTHANTHSQTTWKLFLYIGAFESNRTRTTNSYKLHEQRRGVVKIGGEQLMNIVVVTQISISVTIYISFDIDIRRRIWLYGRLIFHLLSAQTTVECRSPIWFQVFFFFFR